MIRGVTSRKYSNLKVVLADVVLRNVVNFRLQLQNVTERTNDETDMLGSADVGAPDPFTNWVQDESDTTTVTALFSNPH